MSRDEQQIESEIQAKNLNAPRLKPEYIDKVIVGSTFTVLPSQRVTVCETTVQNGFTVRGESAVVSITNFNAEIGEKVSQARARDDVWKFEAYLLTQRLYDAPKFERARLNLEYVLAHTCCDLEDEDVRMLREVCELLEPHADPMRFYE